MKISLYKNVYVFENFNISNRQFKIQKWILQDQLQGKAACLKPYTSSPNYPPGGTVGTGSQSVSSHLPLLLRFALKQV